VRRTYPAGTAAGTYRRGMTAPDPGDVFPPGFFARADETDDAAFYGPPRLVTHIDDRAIAAVGALYAELGLRGEVLDLMSSWISHFPEPPRRLVGLGMNAAELAANPALAEHVVQDLNADPRLPFADASFDAVTCCVSVDYLVDPVPVFREVARVLRPGGPFVVTFSNRCFPTKAIRGWLHTDDEGHLRIVHAYFVLSGGSGTCRGSCAPRRGRATPSTPSGPRGASRAGSPPAGPGAGRRGAAGPGGG
jgi:SAM-dependent methyltransferase